MRALAPLAVVLVLGCSSKDPDPLAPSVQLIFDLDADFDSEAGFFRFPWPADVRLSDAGTPRGQSFPNPLGKSLVTGLRAAASDRPGWPVIPTAYFRFDGALAPRSIDTAITSGPILLLDIDDASPDRGKTIPVVASTLMEDDYVPSNVLGVAARPGFVLHGKRTYAFVVLSSAGDAKGAPLGQPAALGSLLHGQAPPGARGAAMVSGYAKLAKVLGEKSIALDGVAAATVFTTGDVVAALADLSDKMVAKHGVNVIGLRVDPDDGAKHDRYCEVQAIVNYPQFQKGTQPFDTDGLFVMGKDGLPEKQGDLVAPITFTLPKAAMPKGGYPLVLYFHGSGGVSGAVADRGRWRPTDDVASCPGPRDEWLGKLGCNTKGEGPGHVVAPFGIAMAASALPVNPERLPGAKETAYLNFANLAAFRDTFRQGVIEQRLLLRALEKLVIPPSVVAACTGMSLPAGEPNYRFATADLMAQGQSMGGMYTNIIGAVEPKVKALVPTGAGGYWAFMITKTKLYDDTSGLVASLLGANREGFSFMHPSLQLLETAWEPSDPIVYMPRVARRPLPGHPARSIYEAAGKDDSYFPTVLYDAVALAYGHPEAGDPIWSTMQDALALSPGLAGLRPFPISGNLKSEDGRAYTGVLVQYAGDGVYDPHAIYTQLDAVKYQYGCFYASVLAKKTPLPTIVAPAALGTPCP